MSGYGAVSGSADEQQVFEKKKNCNDVFFALLFVAHLGWLVILFTRYEAADTESDWTSAGVYKFAGYTSLVAIVLSTVSLFVMSAFADKLVEIALVASLAGSLGVTIYAIVVWKVWMIVVSGISFLFAAIFVWCMWNKIPFAAANLRTAIRAIRTNMGLVFMVYVYDAVAFGFTLLWMNATGAGMNQAGWWTIFLFLLSFYWTQQVIANIQHVMVASVLGTWWYNPVEANECWDDGLNRALCETLTYNFGSICFGSLLVSIVQALQAMQKASARNENCSCLACLLGCCLYCIEGIIEYFNKWAFVYVGVHGDSYIESGKKVMSLFKQRGWDSIITDALADTLMNFMTVSIGLLSGLTGWAIVTYDDDIFVGIGIEPDEDDAAGFVAGLLIGLLIASIMMGAVSSAVNSVIVCFAEAPATFQKNYPELCEDMLTAWKEAYPDECSDDFDAVRPF